VTGIGDNMPAMSGEERRRRADAERNRRRLLDAAEELFRERGLEVGVGEIAERAGVGRGTLFRNFPTKEDLIAAIVVQRMEEAIEYGTSLRDAADPGAALFELLEYMAGASQVNRSLFEAIADTWLANEDIRAGHAQVTDVLEDVLHRAQAAGAVRDDVSAIDVMMLVKGVCEAANALAHSDPNIIQRQFGLVRAALVPPATPAPLSGQPPKLSDMDQVFSQPRDTTVAKARAG
jgi:AcrR family transcriptional regulator